MTVDHSDIRDGDHYADANKTVAKIAVLALGAFRASQVRIAMDGLTLQEADINQERAGVVFIPPAPVFRFGPEDRATERWDGQELRPDTIRAHHPGRDAHFIAQPGAWGTVALSPQAWHDATSILWGDAAEARGGFLVRPKPGRLARLRAVHRAASALALSDGGATLGHRAREALRDVIIETLLDCLDKAVSLPSRGVSRHSALLRRLEDMCEGGSECPVSLTALCVEMGISQRRLQVVCKEAFGCSARDYLRRRKLLRSRSALLRAVHGETTVSRVAMDCGFWELGRFAATYRAEFGETPSTTLRRGQH